MFSPGGTSTELLDTSCEVCDFRFWSSMIFASKELVGDDSIELIRLNIVLRRSIVCFLWKLRRVFCSSFYMFASSVLLPSIGWLINLCIFCCEAAMSMVDLLLKKFSRSLWRL